MSSKRKATDVTDVPVDADTPVVKWLKAKKTRRAKRIADRKAQQKERDAAKKARQTERDARRAIWRETSWKATQDQRRADRHAVHSAVQMLLRLGTTAASVASNAAVSAAASVAASAATRGAHQDICPRSRVHRCACRLALSRTTMICRM
jgi:hypothetical protein